MKYSVKSILFLGVGGISMHQLAIFFKKLGARVYGYDRASSKFTKKCEAQGINVAHKYNKDFCKVDLCVCSQAVKNEKYFNQLKKLGVPIIDRADILAWICSKFKVVIGVAGTHGKTTTAAIIYDILKRDGRKVSCHIGAEIEDSRLDFSDDILVVEACEYKKSFLKIKPNISVVTNVESEHMDSYKTMFNLRSAFMSFVKHSQTRFVGAEKNTKFLNKCANINWVEVADLDIKPKLLGEYNRKNIALALAVVRYLGVKDKAVQDSIKSFAGVKRRYEFLGEWNKNKIYIDYAHHPTEVKAFISTFLEHEKNAQIIFQPHTFSRTQMFCEKFVEIFKDIKNLIIYKEYAAREDKQAGMSARELFEEIKKVNDGVKYCNSEKTLIKHLKCNSACAFIGAGDINLVAENLLNLK